MKGWAEHHAEGLNVNELILIAAALTSLGAFRVFLWKWRPDRRDGSKRRFPYVSTAVLGLAAGYLWFVGIRHARLEARLNEVASTLAGKSVTVDCETPVVLGFTDNEGEVWFLGGVPENRTTLRKGACSGLLSYIEGEKSHPTEREVMGVGVLTHESMHMAGKADEAEAECASVQRIGRTAVLLGASEEEALDLAHSYMLIWYPRLPSRYHSPECVPGGSLDEHIPLPPW